MERHILIISNVIYLVDGRSPPVDRILQIDSGFLWVALAERLGGDIVSAEDALRDAIWGYAKLFGTDTGDKGIADIDLAVAEMMVNRWKKKPTDWFAWALTVAFRYMHSGVSITPDGIGGIWGDAWRLYAGALSVLGDETSRRVPGDADDYQSARVLIKDR